MLNRLTDLSLGFFFADPVEMHRVSKEDPHKLVSKVEKLEKVFDELLQAGCIRAKTRHALQRITFEHLENIRAGRRTPMWKLQVLASPFFDFKDKAEMEKGFKKVYFDEHTRVLFVLIGLGDVWERIYNREL